MADIITEVGGIVTLAGNLEVKDDLKVSTDATIGANLIISGDAHIEGGITEVTPNPRFSLTVPGIPLTSGAHCYSVAPCALTVISMHAVLVELIDDVVGNAPKITLSVGGVPDVETLLVGDETSLLGTVFSITFATPSIGAKLDVLLVESNGTAATTGIVDVTLICKG